MKKFLFVVVLVTIFILTGCSGNIVKAPTDKFEGIWVSEVVMYLDKILYYDTEDHGYKTFNTADLPGDIFTLRELGVANIKKYNNNYEADITTYVFQQIDKDDKDYVAQLEYHKKYDDRSLQGQFIRTSNVIIDGNTITLKGENKHTLIGNAQVGNRIQQVRVEVYPVCVFDYDEKNDILRLTQCYYEAEDGSKKELPLKDPSRVAVSVLKRYDETTFNKLLDNAWAKSFEIAKKESLNR